MSFGYNIKAGPNSVVLGSNRDLSALSGVISLGAQQTVDKNNTVNIGQGITNTGDSSVVMGSFSSNTAFACTSIGHNGDTAGFAYCTPIGFSITSTAPYQVKFGDQHLELSPPTSIPATPVIGELRLYMHQSGAGVSELRLKGGDGILYKLDMTPVV